MSDDGSQGRPERPWPPRVTSSPELAQRINREWRITAPSAPAATLRQRLAQAVRRLLAPLLRSQEAFNSAVVQQLNHLADVRDTGADRDEALHAMASDLFQRSDVLSARFAEVEASLDDMRRLPEALAAGERRLGTSVAALAQQQAELRTALGVLQHETRQLSKALAAAGPPGAPAQAPAATAAAMPPASSADALSHTYVGFEDAFRGSPEAIRAGLAAYVPLFAGCADVLDVGCGRGEFLTLLREAGIGGRGIDLNEAMVEVCRERGVDASVGDAVAYLRAQPDASLGGLFAAQVVEHLEPQYLMHFLDAAFDKLRPGAPIVLETINPACWFAFFESYIRDITHQRALHPDTLSYLLVATGFQEVAVRYSAPYPEHEKLQPVSASGLPADTAETLNANVEKMNRLLFTNLDYAAIGRRP